MTVTSIYNYKEIDKNLATGGQPNEEQLAAAAEAGFTLVINLAPDDPRYSLPDEAGSVSGLGMGYVHIPVDFAAPSRDDYLAFRNTMDASSGQKRLVHCAANYRVTAFFSIYGEERLGWDSATAEGFIHEEWQPDETWQRFLDERRQEIRA